MSDPAANGHTPSRSERLQEARRASFDALVSLEESRAREHRRLVEHFLVWDDDWSAADLWQRVRGDQQRTLPSRPQDRRGGADWPLWKFETDLDRLRQKGRVVCATNSYARGLRKNLVNHIVGKGFSYKIQSKEGTPDADPHKPGKQNTSTLDAYVARAQDVVDGFLRKNRWNVLVDPTGSLVLNGSRERETVARVLRDGEVFLRFYKVDGELVVRFVEPEQVRQPPGATYAEGWSFGVRHRVERSDDGAPVGDVEDVEAYFVYWIDPATVSLVKDADFVGEEVPADEILHVKGPDTDSTVKRGISFFSYDVAASLERARVLQRNASVGAAIRSATAEIWQHHYGTETEVRQFTNLQREYQDERTKGDGSSTTENVEWAYPGMIRRVPAGQEQIFPGQDNTPQYLQGVQGDLRQACAAACAPEYWTADASNGTYAGLKEAGSPAVKNGETEQLYYQAVFARVVWKALQVAVDEGRLDDTLHLLDLQVEGAAVLQRDSLQKAQEDQIYLGTRCLSPQTVMMERGRDPELELANIQEFEGRFGAAGEGLPLPDDQGNLPPGMQDDAGGALHDRVTAGPSEAPAGPQADPKMAVTNLKAIADLQAQFYAGELPREAVVANLVLLFGFTPAQAASLFPEVAPKKLTPDEPTPQAERGPPASPFPEALQEAAGTCKQGERSDLTGCTPASGTLGGDGPQVHPRERLVAAKDAADAAYRKWYATRDEKDLAAHHEAQSELNKASTAYDRRKRSMPARREAAAARERGEAHAEAVGDHMADLAAARHDPGFGRVWGAADKVAYSREKLPARLEAVAALRAATAEELPRLSALDVSRLGDTEQYEHRLGVQALRKVGAAAARTEKEYRAALDTMKRSKKTSESVQEECAAPGCEADCDKPILEDAPALDVPDERQVEGYACGAACVVSVCRFFGAEPDRQNDALRQLGTSPRDGTDPERIITVLRDHGLETVSLAGIGMEEIEYFLSRGMPLIACCQAWGTPEEVAALESGHYVVLVGSDAESVTVMDPARFDDGEPEAEYGGRHLGGQKVQVPKAEFLKRWRDVDADGNAYTRYAIAVRGGNAAKS